MPTPRSTEFFLPIRSDTGPNKIWPNEKPKNSAVIIQCNWLSTIRNLFFISVYAGSNVSIVRATSEIIPAIMKQKKVLEIFRVTVPLIKKML